MSVIVIGVGMGGDSVGSIVTCSRVDDAALDVVFVDGVAFGIRSFAWPVVGDVEHAGDAAAGGDGGGVTLAEHTF